MKLSSCHGSQSCYGSMLSWQSRFERSPAVSRYFSQGSNEVMVSRVKDSIKAVRAVRAVRQSPRSSLLITHIQSNSNCEAQGKGRAKGRLRMVTQRSFVDYRLSIIDIFSLELTLNLVDPPSTTTTFPPVLLIISRIKPIMGQVR